MIAWDTETRSFKWWENPAFLGSWDAGEGGNVAVLPTHGGDRVDRTAHRQFMRVLKNKHHVGANLKFDAHMGYAAFGKEIVFKPGNTWDDVLMMSRLLYGARRTGGHNLEDLSDDFLDDGGKGSAKDAMSERYKELTGRSDMKHDDAYYDTWKAFPEEVEFYAAKDAEDTRALYDVLEPELRKDDKLYRLYTDVERPVMEVIYQAERTGVQIDPAAVVRLSNHYQQRDNAARRALTDHLGFVPEGDGSEERLREALLGAGVPLTERTEKTKELAVNAKALGKFRDHPAVEALFEWRKVNKFLSTYINPLEGKDHIHPTFGQADAWTGRMASQSPNMQNFPKRSETTKDENLKVRSVIVPTPGFEFLIGDYESIEVFTLAHFIGDPGYKELVKNGDPHARTAAVVWPHISPRWEDFRKSTPNRFLRDAAKQVTYSIVYGGGGRVIMETVNREMHKANRPDLFIDEDQARAIRRKIAANIPGFKDLTDSPWRGKQYPQGRIYKQLHSSIVGEQPDTQFGYVRTLMGRKQWIQTWPEDKSYVGLSGLIQGSAADIMKAGAINVFNALKPHGGRPVLFVHDELVAEVPLGHGEHLKPLFVEAMEAGAEGIDPHITVEANVTARSYAHSD